MIFKYVIAFIASLMAGGMNAIAGGGTLVTFPTLISLGLSPLVSNTTNTVALWTGSLLGAIGYKAFIKDAFYYIKILVLPSLFGGIVGSLLLVYTPEHFFNLIVPFLILFASIIFSFGSKISKYTLNLGYVYSFIIQFFTAIYGGYFGAGMGIIMLGSILALGVEDIHVANTIKNTLAFLINLIAAVVFIIYGKVRFDYAFVMMIGFGIGGFLSSILAQKINRKYLKIGINMFGYFLSFYYFIKTFL